MGSAARIAGVVGDPAVLERDVEVDAHEHALSRRVEVADGELVHGGGRAVGAASGARGDAGWTAVRGRRRSATKPIRSATRQL